MRPTWDEYYLKMLPTIAERATCDRGKSGAVITKDNRILSTGYVGSPSGQIHCDDIGHELVRVNYSETEEKNHCIRTVHAEMNAIYNAAKFGVSLDKATLYCSMVPCRNCAMGIVSVGITKVIAQRRYQKDDYTIDLFAQAGVQLSIINDEVQEY